MQTEQTMTRTMVLPENETDDTLGYPTNQLISVVDDWKSLNQTILTLVGAGIEPNQIEVLYGAEGIRRLDVGHWNRGLGERLMRWLSEIGPEHDILQAYHEALLNGCALIAIRHPNAAQRSIIERTLSANGGHLTRFFGRFAVHVLAP